jgi:uncharacterized protein (TIRG00374 family)
MAIESAVAHQRFRWWAQVRYALGLSLGIAALFVLFSQRGNLRAAWHQLTRVSIPWLLGAVIAETMSIFIFAYVQRRVLKMAGTRIGVAPLFAISLANNAIANTVPGEPAVSSAFRYRQYRRRGASRAGSGWTILTIIIAQAIGMSSVLLVGVLVSLATSSNATNTRTALVGLFIVLGAGVVLLRRDLLLRFLGGIVRLAQRLTGHPRGDIGERIVATLQRMREIELRPFDALEIIAWATLVWGLDLACLLCSMEATHAPIPWHGIILAYGVAQIVAVLPIVPGGIGLVEGGLTVILVAYGSTRVHALSSVLVYRAISFWFAVIVGWLSYTALSLGARRKHTDSSAPRDHPRRTE